MKQAILEQRMQQCVPACVPQRERRGRGAGVRRAIRGRRGELRWRGNLHGCGDITTIRIMNVHGLDRKGLDLYSSVGGTSI